MIIHSSNTITIDGNAKHNSSNNTSTNSRSLFSVCLRWPLV